jgi:type II secretory pathway predicted ATPase ExeA
MEVAMADNLQYLGKFRQDIQEQRFALIVVDPLSDKTLARRRAFAEENNVWVTQVARYILCNYREEEVFAADEIALYVPQVGTRQCP